MTPKEDEALKSRQICFPAAPPPSLCRLEACSLSLALQWAQTWYDLNKPERAGVRDEAIFFFPPLTQSSCFQTLNSTAGYNLCTVKMQTHTFLYTLESSWVLLYGYTCRGIWLLEQNRCFYAVKHLYYTLLVVLSPPFCSESSPCEFTHFQQFGSGVMIVFLWVMPQSTDNGKERC